jgi:filamentous hemagglutinin family protein
MPTANRRRFVPEAIRLFLAQDYPAKELIVLDDGEDSVADLIPNHRQIRYLRSERRENHGVKCNLACEATRGDIIAHWDDDDWYASWRLSYQVNAIVRGSVDICGLARMLFFEPAIECAWEYVYPSGIGPWVYGATFCYRKSMWQERPFLEIPCGSDNFFLWDRTGVRLRAVPRVEMYIGLIHGTNTSRKQTQDQLWRLRPVKRIRRIVGSDWAQAPQRTTSRKTYPSPVSTFSTSLGAATTIASALTVAVAPAYANPKGGQVSAGSASINQTSPTQLDIVQSTDRGAINWQSFSIAPNEQTNFQQPSASSMTLNRVTPGDPSVIAGRLTANGGIVLINPSGVTFSKGSQVDVNTLIATPTDISNANFMAGRMKFDKPSTDPRATVVNDGKITVAEHGLAALVAPGVANSGTIQAKLGKVVLGGAQTYTVDFYGDGLISFDVGSKVTTVPVGPDGKRMKSLVSNTGQIDAPGGTVVLTADAAAGIVENVVDVPGQIIARTRGPTPGAVTIDAGAGGGANLSGKIDVSGLKPGQSGGSATVTGGSINVASTAQISARGNAGGGTVRVGGGPHGADPTVRNAATAVVATGAVIDASATGIGNGGQVTIWSDQATQFAGTIKARGGPNGGDGGWVETSGKSSLSVLPSALVDAAAPMGKAGSWLLDPEDLLVNSTNNNISPPTGPSATSPTVTPTGVNASVDATVVSATLNGGTNVTLTTVDTPTAENGNINVNAQTITTPAPMPIPISWSTAAQLTLNAAGSISIQTPIVGPNGSLALVAGGTVSQTNPTSGTIPGGTLTVANLRALTLNNNGSAITLTNPNNVVTGNVTLSALNSAGTAPTPGAINFVDGTGFTVTAQPGNGLNGQETGVNTNGTVFLSSLGAINVSGIVGNTNTGSVSLSTNTNDILVNSVITSGTFIELNPAGNLTLSANLTASSVAIDAGGSVTQNSGTITATTLSVVGASVSLPGANAVGNLSGAASGSRASFVFRDESHSLTIATTCESPPCSALTTNGGALTVATTGTTGPFDLNIPSGTIVSSAGGPITLMAGGVGSTFTNAGAIDSILSMSTSPPTAAAAGNVTILADAMVLAGGTINAVTPGASGKVVLGPVTPTSSVALGGTGSLGTTLGLAASDLATVTAGQLQIGYPNQNGSATTSGGINISTPITIDTTKIPTLLLITSGGITEMPGGFINSTGGAPLMLGIQAGGTVTMDEANQIGTLNAVVNGGATKNLTFRNAGAPLMLNNTVLGNQVSVSFDPATGIPNYPSAPSGVVVGGINQPGTPAPAIATNGGFLTVVTTGTSSTGFDLTVDAPVTSSGGPITLMAGGSGATFLNSSTVNSTSADIAILADAMTLSAGTIGAGSAGTVLLGPMMPTNSIVLGSASSAGTLGFMSGDLATVTAGMLQIGYRNQNAPSLTGNINIASPLTINTSLVPSLLLVTGGLVTQSSGATITKLIPTSPPSTPPPLSLGVIAGGPVTLGEANQVDTVAGYVDGATNSFLFRNDSAALAIGSLPKSTLGVAFDATTGIPLPAVMTGPTPNPLSGITSQAGGLTVSVTGPGTTGFPLTVAAPVLSIGGPTVLTASGTGGSLIVNAAVGNASSGSMTLTGGSGGISIDAPITSGQRAPVYGVNLVAMGPITEGAAGSITAPALRALTKNDAGAPIILTNAANAVSIDATLTTLNAAGTALAPGDIAFADSSGFTVTPVAGNGQGGLELGANTTGNISLSAGGPLSLNAIVNTPNMVTISATGAIFEFPAGSVSAGTLVAQTKNDGGAAITLSNSTNAAGSVTLNALNTAGTAPAAGAIRFIDSTGFTVAGIDTNAGVTLEGGGTISINGAVGNSSTGPVSVTANSKDILIDAPVTSGSSIFLFAESNIGLAANLSAPAVFLDASGAITQTAGAIAANTLDVFDPGGSVSLPDANAVDTLTGFAGGSFLFRNDGHMLTVGCVANGEGSDCGVSTNGGNIILETTTSGNLVLSQTVDANSNPPADPSTILGPAPGLVALSSAGTITQSLTNGLIVASGLEIQSVGAVSLGAANRLGADDVPQSTTGIAATPGMLAGNVTTAGQSFLFRDDRAPLTIGTVDVVDRFGVRQLNSQTAVGLPTGGISGVTANGGNVILETTTAGNLLLSQTLNAGAGSAGLASAGRITQDPAPIIASQLAILSADRVSLGAFGGTSDLNQVGTLAGQVLNAGESFVFRNDAKTLTIGTVDVLDSFGARLLNPVSRSALTGVLSGVMTNNANIGLRVTSSGDLVLAANVNTGSAGIGFESAGTVQQTAGAVTGGTLEISAVGTVSLLDANAVPLLAAQATGSRNSFSFRDDGLNMTVGSVGPLLETGTGTPPNNQMLSVAALSGVTTNGGDIALHTTTAGNLALPQNVNANGGRVALVSAGNASEAGGIVMASGLILDAAGNVAFGIQEAGNTAILGNANAVGTLSGSAGGVFGFLNAGALTIGTVSSVLDVASQSGIAASAAPVGDVLIQTNGATQQLTLAGNISAGGRAILDSAGAFSQIGTVNVSDPVLAIDTTGSGVGTLLSFIPSTNVGASAISNLPPAGRTSNPMSFGGLQALNSTVLLFADRGVVNGAMNVAGLGLSGTGASANLTGSIAGVTGPIAALGGFRDPGPDPNYLFNDCIIAATSCGQPLPPTVPSPPTAQLPTTLPPPTEFLVVEPQAASELSILTIVPNLTATLNLITPQPVTARELQDPDTPVINIFDEERLCTETPAGPAQTARERCEQPR